MNDTRIFFVTDSTKNNEEIFDIYEEAMGSFNSLPAEDKPRLYIAKVKNAYYESDIKIWNYSDEANTFEIVKILREK